MSTAIDRLLKLAEDAERHAAAYRLAAAALNGHAVDKRAARAPAVLEAALAVDATRRRGKGKPAKPKRRSMSGGFTRARLAIRERTARVLALVAEKGPMTAAEIREATGSKIRMGTLSHNGFLKAVGDKYKRTAKPFAVDWREKPTP